MMATDTQTKRTTYVNTLWCFYLYECCQYMFEKPDEVEFTQLLNLRCDEHSIVIRSKEKYRFCYFLYILAEESRFSINVRKSWLSQILKATNIKENYYKSHYTDPLREEFKNLKYNKAIVKDLKETIKYIRSII